MDFNDLLNMMIEHQASDLFVTAEVEPSMKINGQIMPVAKTKLSGEVVGQLVNSIMSDKQRKEFADTRECNFAIMNKDKTARFRVSAFQQRDEPGMILRRIETVIPTPEQLKLPPILKDLAMTKRGIIIFVGATGTGKSTSLASLIGYRNQNSKGHIITIEDPIEFVHQSKKALVNQRELHQHTHSFANALKSALREDPDVILVGEMRDPETIGLALTAAETGHLVFGTLHTTGAAKTVDRIVDVFPAGEKEMVRSMLSESLRAVISQTLLKTKDGSGRVAAHEIMLSTPAVRNLIRENKIAQIGSVMQTGQQHGMQTLDQCLQNLVRRNQISIDMARSKASNPDLIN